MIPYELCMKILKAHTGLTEWYDEWDGSDKDWEELTRMVFAYPGETVQMAEFEVAGDSLYLKINGEAKIIGLDLPTVERLYKTPIEGIMPTIASF